MPEDSIVEYFVKIGLKYSTYHGRGYYSDTTNYKGKIKIINYNSDLICYNFIDTNANDTNAIILEIEKKCDDTINPYRLTQMYIVKRVVTMGNYLQFLKKGEF